MSRRRKFMEHFVFNGMLLWLAMFVVIFAMFAQYPHVLPIVFTGLLGIIFLVISKLRYFKTEQYTKFGYKELQRFEKVFYLIGYFFIAASLFAAAAVFFALRNPPN